MPHTGQPYTSISEGDHTLPMSCQLHELESLSGPLALYRSSSSTRWVSRYLVRPSGRHASNAFSHALRLLPRYGFFWSAVPWFVFVVFHIRKLSLATPATVLATATGADATNAMWWPLLLSPQYRYGSMCASRKRTDCWEATPDALTSGTSM